MLTPSQSRAARGLLGLRLEDLSARTGIAAPTIGYFEGAARRTQPAVVKVLQLALEEAGAVFIPADAHGGPGVRLHASADR